MATSSLLVLGKYCPWNPACLCDYRISEFMKKLRGTVHCQRFHPSQEKREDHSLPSSAGECVLLTHLMDYFRGKREISTHPLEVPSPKHA